MPNDLGNYPGKRESKPTPPAPTPRERFVRLAADFLTHSHTPNKGAPNSRTPAKPMRDWLGQWIRHMSLPLVGLCAAHTRSEARAIFKKIWHEPRFPAGATLTAVI